MLSYLPFSHIFINFLNFWIYKTGPGISFHSYLIENLLIYPTSQVSRTSISSEMNITSLGEFANGQYFRRPSKRKRPREGSFAKKSMEHLIKCSWNKWDVCTLWRGMITFLKNTICSSLRGTANPEIMDARMSRSSEAPLNLKVSWMRL